MITNFSSKKISAMLGILPETIGHFDDEIGNYSFPAQQTMRLKKVMGYNQHRLSKETSTVSDFGVFGLNYILQNGWIKKEEIGAVVVVSLCPDYFVPHNSNIIAGNCGLGDGVICLDIAQGCCGFLIGLMQSFMLLDHLPNKKVVLVNGDVLSHKISKRDRNDYPLVGDAATITIVENDASAKSIYYEMHMDGSRGGALKIPAGGFRMPASSDTAKMQDLGDGNFRALDHMHMDGSEIFNFVQTDVASMLLNVFNKGVAKIEDFDYFFFHQPNRFMLQKLAEKVGIPKDKLFMNLVENFGNPSGASIPLTAIYNCRESLLKENKRCCLAAFGSGLAWGVMFMDIGNLDYCEMVESTL